MKYYSRIGFLGAAAMLAASPVMLHANAELPSEQKEPIAQLPTGQDAPIALLVDAGSGQILHSREGERRFLPASITKVMTVYVAFEMLAEGRLSADQTFTVSENTFEKWSGTGSSMFLQRGEEVSVDTLLRGITTVSANDGCVALAEGASGTMGEWIDEMNSAAQELGMRDSHFESPNGFPDEGMTFTSASDLARLTHALISRHPELYEEYFGKRRFVHNGYDQTNHDPITGVVPGADGIKTGFTREAGYNFLGSAKRGDRRLAMVVAGVESGPKRADVARKYIEWGFDAFESQQIFAPGATVAYADVQDGASRIVPLESTAPIVASRKKGTKPHIWLRLRYKGPIRAPIAAGSEIAQLEVHVDGFEPYRVPLIAAAEVPEANALQRIRNGLMGLGT